MSISTTNLRKKLSEASFKGQLTSEEFDRIFRDAVKNEPQRIKIILLCAGGMSTSMLVKNMQKAAAEEGFECEIAAYPQADAKDKASNADAILLGPQIRFAKAKVAEDCPGVPIDVIDMRIYGRMDGKGALGVAKNLIAFG